MVKVNRPGALSSQSHSAEWRLLAEIMATGDPGQRRLALEQVTETIAMLHISPRCMEQLRTAVTRAVVDEGPLTNPADSHPPSLIRVLVSQQAVEERSNPQRSGASGWGHFLIEKMVYEDWQDEGPSCHMVELFLYQEGAIQN